MFYTFSSTPFVLIIPMSVIKAVISCNGLNTLNLPIFYEKINKIRKVHKFFLEFCLILTKYCVKTNSDGVIFQTLIEKIVKAQIGHDIPCVFIQPLHFPEYKIDKTDKFSNYIAPFCQLLT